jgi:hypothetical protein
MVILLASLAQAQPATPGAAPTGANSAANAGDDIVPKLVLADVAPRDAVTTLATQAHLTVEFDPALLNQVAPNVNVAWSDVTARQALQALLDNYGWQLTQTAGSSGRIAARTSNAVGPQRKKVKLPEQAQTNGAAGNEAAAVISMDDVPLRDAIEALARQAQMNIEFDPWLGNREGAKVSFAWKNVTGRQALLALLDNYGWQLTQIPDIPIFRIGAKDAADAVAAGTKVNFSEDAAGIAGNPVISGLAMKETRLADAIQQLAQMARLNIMFDPSAAGQIQASKVTETWKNVTARQALQSLLDSHGLEVTRSPGAILRVGKKTP